MLIDGPPRDHAHEHIRHLALLGLEDPARGLGVGGGRQHGAERRSRVEQLLHRCVDQDYACPVGIDGPCSLLVESCVVALGQQRRRRQGLQADHGTVKLTVDVTAKIERDLLHAPLQLLLFQVGHLMEGEQGDGEQRQRQRDTEQDEKSANALGRNSVDEQSRGHDLADADCPGVVAALARPVKPRQ